ncbi:MAG TPA: NAD-dependent epimerase/dehydratase family protein [Spirochaetia bacterium]|nr:NAD-dependent epimerase/dehydratase family protein [Spirochaetales bacterium]HRY79909.1 NAD-dependent epimerase/dehydratase family protein [Spirochaetia bacterium]HRZ89177.1 NAD-dependent epimerase/dehydratase family protein [Spirochaetia bacterium]
MRIFITGATGYIGSALALSLLEEGHEVAALARNPDRGGFLAARGARVVRGDLGDEGSLDRLCEGAEAGFHLAGWVKASGSPADYEEANVAGARRAFEAAVRAGVRRVVFTSSAGVLGPALDGSPVHEDSPRRIGFLNDYERTKAQAEILVPGFLDRGLEIVTVNPTRVYGCPVGPDLPPYTAMIDRYLRGKFLLIPGDGRSLGNYAFLDDVVEGHRAALARGVPGRRHLLGGHDLSYRDFFAALARASGVERRLPTAPAALLYAAAGLAGVAARLTGGRPLLTPAWVKRFLYDWKVSSARAESELGYQITPLPVALARTVRGLRDRGGY